MHKLSCVICEKVLESGNPDEYIMGECSCSFCVQCYNIINKLPFDLLPSEIEEEWNCITKESCVCNNRKKRKKLREYYWSIMGDNDEIKYSFKLENTKSSKNKFRELIKNQEYLCDSLLVGFNDDLKQSKRKFIILCEFSNRINIYYLLFFLFNSFKSINSKLFCLCLENILKNSNYTFYDKRTVQSFYFEQLILYSQNKSKKLFDVIEIFKIYSPKFKYSLYETILNKLTLYFNVDNFQNLKEYIPNDIFNDFKNRLAVGFNTFE
jgi:hypothetical protein